jgi:adenylate kinase family enzyme
MNALPALHRIVVVGTTGSGKSTLAEMIARKINADFIELDALHWEPNWTEASNEVFRARVDERTRKESWVVAGNYHVVRDIVWSRAQFIIWLDYSLSFIFWRLTKRIFKRWWTQEVLWGTNRETLFPHFKIWSQESLWHWLFKTYWRRKREYPALFALPQHAHLNIVRLTSQAETDRWLNNLSF